MSDFSVISPLFPRMVEVLPVASRGLATVEHFEVSKQASRFSGLRPGEFVAPGRYARLSVDETLMMSDTDAERRSNYEVVRRATGDVLVAGLGLGMIFHPILAKPEVRSVTVVEKFADVVALVEPTLSPVKLRVVVADIFAWKPPTGVKWDAIYFDIWPDICVDNLKEMATLHRRFSRRLNPSGWMGSWKYGELLALRQRGRR